MTTQRTCIALAFGLLAVCSAKEAAGTGPTPATLDLGWDGNRALSIRVSNTGENPMLVFRPYHPSLWYGWQLEISGPKGRFGFVTAPSPFVSGSDAFLVLYPGESFVKMIDLSEAVAFDLLPSSGEERAMLRCPGSYRASVSYIFDFDAAERERQGPAMRRAFDALATVDRSYEPMRPTRSAVLELVVK